MDTLSISPGHLRLDDLFSVHKAHRPIELDSACFDAIRASTQVVNDVIENNQTVYGINTGFGLLANIRIEKDELNLRYYSFFSMYWSTLI